ncbi:restriction endonuclease subunit S [Prevotella brevis]|uniref:Restriction endonuclease subunit S n=1 Tax=Xylanibacter brevis TaxID=83231 RepID=A0ABS9CHR1_9BACT|nr:restriction endonuclease subunit S [Xylanibacter brevis]MCF2564656.1 restriction endonuclease subunit S [Xylanibacter brevis]
MTTTKNNEHKKLNFSSEREQSQACLNSAEHEKNQGRKVLNVPTLRFPEFQGEWISKTIGDIAPLQRGFDLPTGQICNGKIPVVYSNGIMNHHSSYKCVAPGLVTGRSGTIGKFTYIEDGYYWPHNTSLWVTDFHDNNPKFIYYLYQTIHIEQYSTGSGVPTLNRNNVHRHKTFIPKLKEQNKIAAFLSLLDERISTQSKIIDKLQSLIKGLRVRLIQIENGNIVHLGEIARIYQPQTISSTELTEDGFLVYGANGIIGKYKEYNHKTEQICITCRGNTCGMVNYTKPMSWITGNAMVINTDEHQNKVCKRYLYHYLSAYNFNSLISGSGQPQIVRTPLEQLKVTLPTFLEQKQKATFLDKIQGKIEISNKTLNLYLQQKQYLLHQMFI